MIFTQLDPDTGIECLTIDGYRYIQERLKENLAVRYLRHLRPGDPMPSRTTTNAAFLLCDCVQAIVTHTVAEASDAVKAVILKAECELEE